jgi:hypothetical protein
MTASGGLFAGETPTQERESLNKTNNRYAVLTAPALK